MVVVTLSAALTVPGSVVAVALLRATKLYVMPLLRPEKILPSCHVAPRPWVFIVRHRGQRHAVIGFAFKCRGVGGCRRGNSTNDVFVCRFVFLADLDGARAKTTAAVSDKVQTVQIPSAI